MGTSTFEINFDDQHMMSYLHQLLQNCSFQLNETYLLSSQVYSNIRQSGYSSTYGTNTEDKTFQVVLSVVCVSFIFGSFFFFNIITRRYWDKGVFPPFTFNRRTNQYEAVVFLAVNLIRSNKESHFEKRTFLQAYLNKEFRDIEGSVIDSFKLALSNPVTTQSVAYWMNKHQQSEQEKKKLLTFLIEIAMIDGVIGPREYNELSTFCQYMQLDQKLLENRVNEWRRMRAEQLHEEHKRTASSNSTRTSNHLKERYVAVLELSHSFTEEQLKKAYRNKAKKYHPDTMKLADKTKTAEFQQRFLEIQEAYEYLMKTM